MDLNNSLEQFNPAICKIFSHIIQQDELNVIVLFYIAECEKKKIPINVKTICGNIKVKRRIGIKNKNNKVVSFSIQEDLIDRKTAEKIVERLEYASLIYFDVLHPYKYIKLTTRGVQVAIQIKKRQLEEINSD